MSAVVLFDVASETAAKTAVLGEPRSARKGQLGRDPGVPEVLRTLTRLWQERTGRQDEQPSEIVEVQRLHELRNRVQHDSVIPSPDDVTRSRLRASDFVSWIAEEWFGTELALVSRASLIENRAVRELVQQAERLGTDGGYGQAAEKLAIAFELARRNLRGIVAERGHL
jgi:hypothetical protein